MIQFSVSSNAAVAIKNYKQELINALNSNLLDQQFIELIQSIDQKYIEEIASGIGFHKKLPVDIDKYNQCLTIARSLQNNIKSDSDRIKQLGLIYE